ncbi:hypothetical protein F383_00086 [Gossypium arboreum]|uniref:Uncharacterized protein n=1 Tax=Gossypium arboreum TaxID=29729 RepID=A0A0B0MTL8_GOSAR|nr:hypothetical protein F383_30734 [Gossypium arboreum]KHG13718.1 hypothetical protein F383_00086 [Gossypium arboreum]
MFGTWHRCRYMRASCRQASIGSQGMSDASITLSSEAFGIASLNMFEVVWVSASKGGKKAW